MCVCMSDAGRGLKVCARVCACVALELKMQQPLALPIALFL